MSFSKLVAHRPGIGLMLAVLVAGPVLILARAGGAPPEIASLPIPPYEPHRKEVIQGCLVAVLDEALVPATEAGVLTALDAKEGAQVEKDELIAQVDDQLARLDYFFAGYEYEAARLQSESNVEVELAEKGKLVAMAELESVHEALEKAPGSVSQSDRRKREFQVQQAEAQYKYAQHQKTVAAAQAEAKKVQYARAKALMERRQIKAPIAGEVVEVFKHVGEWVNPGDPVVRIVRMDKLRVEGYAKAQDWARYDLIRRKVLIEVQLAGGQTETVPGVITYADAMIDQKGDFVVRAEIDNREFKDMWVLQPNMSATMTIQDQPLAASP